ncbi:DUF3224 domain-containing protein [Pleionea sp. CnH1-48]|uniref:DUF3224 domain-containing protein n=1 Tax=Pleionea sp. CnH1-48 TaxID=2954494 RepID=UPI002096F86D|nr:DUF3224 domain-containing protein [Pleionea sp. CnH1-48]MCO7225351.1 DUF3224 domain-containing protein [Pleionea sp. CnH1-48]
MSDNEFTIDSWEESSYFEDTDGTKLARVKVEKVYRGALEGKGELNYLMSYNDDGSADFIGLERVEGSIAGKSGSFVLSHEGTYNEGTVNSTFTLLEKSASEDLKGLSASGSYTTSHSMVVPFDLTYKFTN